MPSTSEKMRRFMALAHSVKTGKRSPRTVSAKVRKAASGMSEDTLKDFLHLKAAADEQDPMATDKLVDAVTPELHKSHLTQLMIAGALATAATGGGYALYRYLQSPYSADTKATKLDVMRARALLWGADERLKRYDPKAADVPMATGLHRVAVPRRSLSEDILPLLGYRKALIAVPEKGQKGLATWRQPDSRLHLHPHEKNWFIHKDRHGPITMERFRTEEAKKDNPRAPFEGTTHLMREGVPGMLYYLLTAPGRKTMEQKMKETKGQQKEAASYGRSMSPRRYEAINYRREPLPQEERLIRVEASKAFPKVFTGPGDPIAADMASPLKGGAMAGAIGGAAAGAATYGLRRLMSQYLGQDLPDYAVPVSALTGMVLAAMLAYHRRKNKNENIEDMMLRLPPGATRRDLEYNPVHQMESGDPDSIMRTAMLAAAVRGQIPPALRAQLTGDIRGPKADDKD